MYIIRFYNLNKRLIIIIIIKYASQLPINNSKSKSIIIVSYYSEKYSQLLQTILNHNTIIQ